MTHFHFCLRDRDGSTLLKNTLPCADASAAWRTVEEMAHNANETATGSILVTNDCNQVVILVGVASVRALAGRERREPEPRPGARRSPRNESASAL